MSVQSDTERFSRYQSVVDALQAKRAFHKSDIYNALCNEKKAFIGRIIVSLVKDGFLCKNGKKSNPLYHWTRKGEEFIPVRWIDQQVFSTTVKRSPLSDRPRERLLRQGPAELKTTELLAILVRSGQQGESAVHVGEKLAARFGDDLQALSLKARGELKQTSKAIGETAYCQIMAALELGKRLSIQKKSASDKPYKIRKAADALAYCRKYFGRLSLEGVKEEFHVVLLDQALQVMKTVQITVGLSDKSLVHPREVFKPAIQEAASAIILVHNHPSGDPTPSPQDFSITEEIKAAANILGLRVLDHVILAKDQAVSIAKERQRLTQSGHLHE